MIGLCEGVVEVRNHMFGQSLFSQEALHSGSYKKEKSVMKKVTEAIILFLKKRVCSISVFFPCVMHLF